ncbi:hypothetical protein O181_031214 [Austropuccinia psidii MF-1]|uniref:Uncharacterized protein n=1 Tax=Austropuccinia psidii MF-1 TaxID=1389203 RepID=A0A9Q3H6B4_9BASI|nr:hypothetical protein [Austropuccinia psidii MF-1]
MEEKESIQSDIHIKPEGHQGSGAIPSFMDTSRFQIWGSKYVFESNQKARTSPSNYEDLTPFYGSVPLSMAPIDPLEPQNIWEQGDLYNPHGL